MASFMASSAASRDFIAVTRSFIFWSTHFESFICRVEQVVRNNCSDG